MSQPSTAATTTRVRGYFKEYTLKPSPRVRRTRLAMLSIGSALAGRRDGKAGVDDAADRSLPANVQRRVDQANAFTSGPLARWFISEQNRLMALTSQVRTKGQVLNAAAERAEAASTDSTELRAEDAASSRRSSTLSGALTTSATDSEKEARQAANDVGAIADSVPSRWRSTAVYVAALFVVFAGEAVINKKAFEIFSERDTTLWVMTAGINAAIILGCHRLGREWKRSEAAEKTARLLLVVLAIGGVIAATVLGTLRYLAIDDGRQDRIRNLSAQVAELQVEREALATRESALPRGKLTAVQREERSIVTTRLSSVNRQIRSLRSQLGAARTAGALERPRIAIPLFLFLNVFLMIVASALSHGHTDLELEEAVRKSRAQRRARRIATFWKALARRRRERDERIARRVQQEAEEERARRLTEVRRSREIVERERARMEGDLATLAGATLALENALSQLDTAYRYACSETERHFRAVITRYWEAHNRQGRRRAAKFEKAWSRASRQAIVDGRPAPKRPEAATWRRPAAQDAELPFVRPTELVTRDAGA